MSMRTAIVVGLALGLGAVGCSRKPPPDDAAITGAVQNQISVARVPGAIVVTTNNGVVNLSGTVPDVRVKARAGEVAVKVPGVARVRNDLNVTMAGDVPIEPAAPPPPPAQQQAAPPPPAHEAPPAAQEPGAPPPPAQ